MSLKRIAIKSNFDLEMFTEAFLNVPAMPEEQAKQVCEALNQVYPQGPNYYAPVDPDYQLYKFEP